MEQKIHTRVRRFPGYERLEHRELLDDLNALLRLWSQWKNLFRVTMKQESERREGSHRIRPHGNHGRTPAQRLIDSGDLRNEERLKLGDQLATLDPFAMRKEIRRRESQLWTRRQALYEQAEGDGRLAPSGDPPLRPNGRSNQQPKTKPPR